MSELFDGAGHTYVETGRRFVDRLVASRCLQSDSRVLDIGCGMGRIAFALSNYLSPEGRYEGIDVVPAGVAWGQTHIGRNFPNFHFTLADVFNAEYNPGGSQRASEYRFPFRDGSFDLVLLSSVFTHLRPEALEHYVREIARMLAPGGHCFATLFLLNDDSRDRMARGESAINFKHSFGTHAVVSTRVPELSIAYDEEYIKRAFALAGLHHLDIAYGGWCGRKPLWSEESGPGDQDVVIASSTH